MRNLVAVTYTLAVAFFVGKLAICMAYLERGYRAIGGEYCLILMAGCIAWKAINYLFDTLEDLKHGQNCEEGRSRGASRMQDNR